MSYYERGSGNFWTPLGVLVIAFGLLLLLNTCAQLPNRITTEKAMAHFYQLSGAKRIEVTVQSNNNLIIGNTHDVVFELLVDGKPMSGRCTSGIVSPMVCRLYGTDTLE